MRGLTLNTTSSPLALSSNPTEIPMGYNQPVPVPLTTACTPNSANRLIPSSGNKLSNSAIKVNSISYKDINPLGSNKYSAKLNVSFMPNSGIRPLSDIKASIVFTVNGADPANARRFQACGSAVPAVTIPRCRICFTVWAWGDPGQCGWQGTNCSGYSDAPFDTPAYSDDTDGRAGGCQYSYRIECI